MISYALASTLSDIKTHKCYQLQWQQPKILNSCDAPFLSDIFVNDVCRLDACVDANDKKSDFSLKRVEGETRGNRVPMLMKPKTF